MRHRLWFALGGVSAALGLLIGAVTACGSDFSARSYVDGRYQRSATDDIDDDARAYRSSRSPSEVAAELTGQWQPADRYVDSTGVYLRYDDDAVVILPAAVGSLILVEHLRTAYPRYAGIVGGHWARRGDTGRGGGPGSGK